MKKTRISIALFTACVLIGLGFATPALSVEDAIIAVVNDEVITLKDLKDYINAVYTQLKIEGRYTEDEIRKIIEQVQEDGINRLIDDRLILNAANEKGIEAKRAAVDEKIAEFRSRYASEQAFLAALAAEGLNVTDLRNRITDQLKSQFFVETEIKSAIKVNPQDVTDYYNEHTGEFKKPERVDLESIFIAYADDRRAAKKAADSAYRLLKDGTAFAEAASQFSKGPSVGIIARGQTKPDIEKMIFALKPGEFTAPMESDQGIFIFKLNRKLPEEILPLEEVKDFIAQTLFNEKLQEKMKAWLKEARSKAYIEIKNPS